MSGAHVRHREDDFGSAGDWAIGSLREPLAQHQGDATAVKKGESLERHFDREAKLVAVEGDGARGLLDAQHDHADLRQLEFGFRQSLSSAGTDSTARLEARTCRSRGELPPHVTR